MTSSTVREPIDSLALSNSVRPGVVGLVEDARPRARADGDHRELHRAGTHRHRADPRGLPGRPVEPTTSLRSRCSGWARPARSATSSPSSARSVPPTSRGTVVAVDGGLTRGPLGQPLKRLSVAAWFSAPWAWSRALVLWPIPANDFLFIPDQAKPLEDKVDVQGGSRTQRATSTTWTSSSAGSRRLEQLLPFTRPDGSTLVPEQAIAPAGTTDQERDRQNAADMQRSELIASAVALKRARVRHRGNAARALSSPASRPTSLRRR